MTVSLRRGALRWARRMAEPAKKRATYQDVLDAPPLESLEVELDLVWPEDDAGETPSGD